jgi:integrase
MIRRTTFLSRRLARQESREGRVGELVARQLQRVFRQAADAAGLDGTVTVHTLRHCSPPISWKRHDIRVIQDLLGHEHITATARYARVALNRIRQIQSPLGWCGKLSPFIRTDRAVFAVEYTDTGIGFSAFCNRANELNCRRC